MVIINGQYKAMLTDVGIVIESSNHNRLCEAGSSVNDRIVTHVWLEHFATHSMGLARDNPDVL